MVSSGGRTRSAKANPFEFAKIGYKYLTETLNLSGIEIYKS